MGANDDVNRRDVKTFASHDRILIPPSGNAIWQHFSTKLYEIHLVYRIIRQLVHFLSKILNFHRKMCKYQLIDVKRSINRGNVLTFLLTILVSLGSIS